MNKKEIDGGSIPENGHYSNQTGHRLRGNFARHLHFFQRQFPGLGAMRDIPQGLTTVSAWSIKRQMFRDPRSGRR